MISPRRPVSKRIMSACGLVCVLHLFAPGCESATTDKSIVPITVGEARRLVELGRREPGLVVLVDPRSQDDFRARHIAGARNIRLPDVPLKASPSRPLNAYATIIVYGEHPGSASARAMTKRLLGIGYEGVRFMFGGLEEWMAVGGEVEPPVASAGSGGEASPGVE
jgi:rhodanese-related sulfurtransferase